MFIDCKLRVVIPFKLMKSIAKHFAFRLLLILTLALFIESHSYATDKKQVFNVLFVAVDDLRPELGCYGNQEIKSPNIDALASESVVFKRAYCQQAICMASRASIMTGMLPETAELFRCGPVNEAYPEQAKLDDIFRDNGYQVKAFGKIYHHAEDHLKQFGNEWLGENSHSEEQGRGYLDPKSISRIYDDSGRGPAFESPDVNDTCYFDGYQAEQAVDAIEGFAKAGKPFFLAVGFKKPHLPFNAPQKYWDLYRQDEFDLAANPYLPKNYTQHTIYNFGELRNYNGIPKGKEPFSEELQRNLIHGYYACVSYMDAQLGKILQKLKETGLDKNTVVVLWGDHGWKLGEHGMWCKHTNFELDTHVPLIIKVPGQDAFESDSFAELIDIYPTLADICNLEAPANIQGESLMPAIKKSGKYVRTEAYSMYPHYRDNRKQLVIGYSLVNKRYRYIRWVHIETGKVEAEELYDHSTDPDENVNIAGSDENSEVLAEMTSLLKKRWVMDATILERE